MIKKSEHEGYNNNNTNAIEQIHKNAQIHKHADVNDKLLSPSHQSHKSRSSSIKQQLKNFQNKIK